MKTRLLILFTLPLLLLSCSNKKEEKVIRELSLHTFYEDLKGCNFIAEDEEVKQTYYDDKTMTYDIVDQTQTGIINFKDQGIFEFYLKEDNNYETHGMLSPNYDLSITDFAYSIYRLIYIEESSWEDFKAKGEKNYVLYPTRSEYNTLIETGYFNTDDDINIARITLETYPLEDKYHLNVIYDENSLNKEDYTIIIHSVNQVKKNNKLEEFTNNYIVKEQNDWNEYQRKAISYYNFWDIPYLSTFTIGLKLYFQRYQTYGSSGYIFIAYDYLGDETMEDRVAQELKALNYQEDPSLEADGVKAFTQEEYPGYNRVISFRYVYRTEIEPYERVAFPHGYMQYSFTYAISQTEISFVEANKILTNAYFPSISKTGITISKVMLQDYTATMNADAYSDDYLEIFKEAGIAQGDLYKKYCSITFAISNKTQAIKFIDNYRNIIKADSRYQPSEYVDDTKSIKDMEMNATSYYYYKDGESFPESSIDIYLNDSTYQTWTGVIEFVITHYTETGKALFSSFVD